MAAVVDAPLHVSNRWNYLPAAPLARLIERMLLRATAEGGDLVAGDNSPERTWLYEEFDVAPRTVYTWRSQPTASVTYDRADRVLTHTPYLWFDVWPQCEGAHEKQPNRACPQCRAFYRARFLFTGKAQPKGFR